MTRGIDKYVLQLHIPMDHSLRMNVRKPLSQVLIPGQCRRFRHLASPAHVFKRLRITACAKDNVHDEIRHLPIIIYRQLMNLDQMRTVEFRQNLRLGEKPLAQKLTVAVVKRKRLQRPSHAGLHMNDLVNRPHSTVSELSNKAIGTNLVIHLKIHWVTIIS